MANEILVKQNAPVVWADSGEYSPSASNSLARTHQIDLAGDGGAGLADTAAWQGAKADLVATRPGAYTVQCRFELDVAPAIGAKIYVYWAASASSTPANDNAGGTSGTDAQYKEGEEAEWLYQLMLIGIFTCTADAATVVQVQNINTSFSPPTRYGMPVVWNESGQAFEGDAVEMCVALIPIVDEVQ